jgi:hypothetical protein
VGNGPTTIVGSANDRYERFEDKLWYRVREIATRLGYKTEKPVRDAINQGELQAFRRPEGEYRVAGSQLRRWLDDNRAFKPATVERREPQPTKTRRPRREMPVINHSKKRKKKK